MSHATGRAHAWQLREAPAGSGSQVTGGQPGAAAAARAHAGEADAAAAPRPARSRSPCRPPRTGAAPEPPLRDCGAGRLAGPADRARPPSAATQATAVCSRPASCRHRAGRRHMVRQRPTGGGAGRSGLMWRMRVKRGRARAERRAARVESRVARCGQVVSERAHGAGVQGGAAAAPRLAQRAHVCLQLADAARQADRGRPQRVSALAAVPARVGVLKRRSVRSLQAAGTGQQKGVRGRCSVDAASVLACPGRCSCKATMAALSTLFVCAPPKRPALRQSAAGRASGCTGEHARPVTL
jgi:hypothetical protein